MRRGVDYRLAPDEVRSFMRAQIEAGKLVQQADWRQWEAKGREAFADAPDLQTELRPKIDHLSEQLLEAYAEFLRAIRQSPCTGEQFERRSERYFGLVMASTSRPAANSPSEWNDEIGLRSRNVTFVLLRDVQKKRDIRRRIRPFYSEEEA